jgi:hypothetical protein
MQARIKSIYPIKSNYRLVNIFGYSSRGVPGLEIIGLGKIGRATKEKFLYLSRLYKLKLPVKRFVLCVEDDDVLKELSAESARWLELPLLILFWSLAEQLAIHRLEDCLTAGKISVCGKVSFFPLEGEQLLASLERMEFYDQNLKWIAPHNFSLPGEFLHLPLEPLFGGKIKISLDR